MTRSMASLVYVSTVAPTGSNNREEEADAFSLWAVDSWQLTDAFNLNLALRYEDVESERKQWADPQRTDLDSKRSNDTDEWLPGVSFTYDFNDNWQALAGVHEGFSPLGGGARENEDPETSTNWEAGIRYRGKLVCRGDRFLQRLRQQDRGLLQRQSLQRRLNLRFLQYRRGGSARRRGAGRQPAGVRRFRGAGGPDVHLHRC